MTRYILSIMCGALSFLMLLPGVWWWAGILCAVAAVILGWSGKKAQEPAHKNMALLGILLAIAGAGAYLISQTFFK